MSKKACSFQEHPMNTLRPMIHFDCNENQSPHKRVRRMDRHRRQMIQPEIHRPPNSVSCSGDNISAQHAKQNAAQ